MTEGNFEELYRKHARKLLGFLFGFLKSRAEAEEVLQEVFLSLWEGKCAEPSRAWLYTVARNRALNRLRGRRTAPEAVNEAPSPEVFLTEKRTRLAFASHVAELPAPLADVYVLRTQGKNYEEMSTELGIPVGTVKSRMHALVGFLKERMKPWTVN